MMDLEAQLATAEFEETWLEVSYHEGGASVDEVEQAMRLVDELRRLATELAQGGAVAFSWGAPRSVAALGH